MSEKDRDFVAREAAGCIRIVFWLVATPLLIFIAFMLLMLTLSFLR